MCRLLCWRLFERCYPFISKEVNSTAGAWPERKGRCHLQCLDQFLHRLLQTLGATLVAKLDLWRGRCALARTHTSVALVCWLEPSVFVLLGWTVVATCACGIRLKIPRISTETRCYRDCCWFYCTVTQKLLLLLVALCWMFLDWERNSSFPCKPPILCTEGAGRILGMGDWCRCLVQGAWRST